MVKRALLFGSITTALLLSGSSTLLGESAVVQTGLALRIGPACDVQANSTLPVVNGNEVTGTSTFTYRLRTSKGSGAAAIRLAFANLPQGTQLNYQTDPTINAAKIDGNSIDATQPVSIAQFGENFHSVAGRNTGMVTWKLRLPSIPESPSFASPNVSIDCQ